MTVGIVGGTGPAGRALALRLAASGNAVLVGSRDRARATQTVSELLADPSHASLDLVGGSNGDAADAAVVVLATPWEAAVSTALALADPLRGKVLVSMVNALARVGGEFQAVVPARGSIAASVQAVLPETFVSTAFQHLPARELADLDRPVEADVFVCADTRRGFDETARLVESIPGLRAVACGSLASANAVEAMTAVLLNINITYKTHASLRLTGVGRIGGSAT